MLSFYAYLLFIWTVLIISYSPGPNVILMINNGIQHSLRDSIFALPGIMLALLFFLIITIFCVSGILKISPYFFIFFKIIGAGYLFYLGIKSLMSSYKLNFNTKFDAIMRSRVSFFKEAFICCITNPNVFFIYLAVIPQFIPHKCEYFHVKIISLCVIQIMISCLSLISYLVLAKKAASFLRKKSKYVSLVCGVMQCFFGVSLLFAEFS